MSNVIQLPAARRSAAVEDTEGPDDAFLVYTSQAAEQLRAAILRTTLPGVGLTVEQCLDEVSARLDSEEDTDIARCIALPHQLEQSGLRFSVANSALVLAREGFLMLIGPARLAARHSGLKVLRPQDFPELMLG